MTDTTTTSSYLPRPVQSVQHYRPPCLPANAFRLDLKLLDAGRNTPCEPPPIHLGRAESHHAVFTQHQSILFHPGNTNIYVNNYNFNQVCHWKVLAIRRHVPTTIAGGHTQHNCSTPVP